MYICVLIHFSSFNFIMFYLIITCITFYREGFPLGVRASTPGRLQSKSVKPKHRGQQNSDVEEDEDGEDGENSGDVSDEHRNPIWTQSSDSASDKCGACGRENRHCECKIYDRTSNVQLTARRVSYHEPSNRYRYDEEDPPTYKQVQSSSAKNPPGTYDSGASPSTVNDPSERSNSGKRATDIETSGTHTSSKETQKLQNSGNGGSGTPSGKYKHGSRSAGTRGSTGRRGSEKGKHDSAMGSDMTRTADSLTSGTNSSGTGSSYDSISSMTPSDTTGSSVSATSDSRSSGTSGSKTGSTTTSSSDSGSFTSRSSSSGSHGSYSETISKSSSSSLTTQGSNMSVSSDGSDWDTKRAAIRETGPSRGITVKQVEDKIDSMYEATYTQKPNVIQLDNETNNKASSIIMDNSNRVRLEAFIVDRRDPLERISSMLANVPIMERIAEVSGTDSETNSVSVGSLNDDPDSMELGFVSTAMGTIAEASGNEISFPDYYNEAAADPLACPNPVADYLASPDLVADFLVTPDAVADHLTSPDPGDDLLASPDLVADSFVTSDAVADPLASPDPGDDLLVSPDPVDDLLASPDPVTKLLASPGPVDDQEPVDDQHPVVSYDPGARRDSTFLAPDGNMETKL